MAGERIHHPRPAELEDFLLGQLSSKQAARVVTHLLTGCESCRREMAPLATVLFTPDLLPDDRVEVGSQYDFPLFRAFAAARRYAATMTRERREAQCDREDLPLREVPAEESLSSGSRSERRWEQCEQFLARCRELRHDDPEAMVVTASLAVSLAQGISPEFRDSRQLADLQARAWAERGNAHRVADHLTDAEADLAQALEQARQGTGDPRLLARVMDLTASLRIDQRRFDEALELLDWVYTIHLELGDRHEAGRALISKSNAAAYSLDLQGAVRLLGNALTLIEADRDPHLVLAVVHNLAYHLIDGGHPEEAHSVLQGSRALYTQYGGRIEQLKARWLEGRIAFRASDCVLADQIFREVRAGFGEMGAPYDLALVSLELAEVWLEQGRTQQIQALLDDTVAVFRARGIGREAIATLLVLSASIGRQHTTVALLRAVASELQRLES